MINEKNPDPVKTVDDKKVSLEKKPPLLPLFTGQSGPEGTARMVHEMLTLAEERDKAKIQAHSSQTS